MRDWLVHAICTNKNTFSTLFGWEILVFQNIFDSLSIMFLLTFTQHLHEKNWLRIIWRQILRALNNGLPLGFINTSFILTGLEYQQYILAFFFLFVWILFIINIQNQTWKPVMFQIIFICNWARIMEYIVKVLLLIQWC